MCLDRVNISFSPKIFTGYKVFHKIEEYYHNPYFDKDKRLILNNWYVDQNLGQKIMEKYYAGFHIFTEKKAAFKYIDNMGLEPDKSRVICTVEYFDFLARGTQEIPMGGDEFEVVVVSAYRIKKEIYKINVLAIASRS